MKNLFSYRIWVLSLLAFTLSIGVGCGSSNSDGQKGGVVGFSTGDP